MNEHKLTRRQVIARGSVLGLVVLGAQAGLSACDGGAADCSNPPGLSAEQRAQRQALHYADRATDPNRRCSSCNFYTAAAEGQCGTCTLNLGSVSPEGSCDSYVARA